MKIYCIFLSVDAWTFMVKNLTNVGSVPTCTHMNLKCWRMLSWQKLCMGLRSVVFEELCRVTFYYDYSFFRPLTPVVGDVASSQLDKSTLLLYSSVTHLRLVHKQYFVHLLVAQIYHMQHLKYENKMQIYPVVCKKWITI